MSRRVLWSLLLLAPSLSARATPVTYDFTAVIRTTYNQGVNGAPVGIEASTANTVSVQATRCMSPSMTHPRGLDRGGLV